MISLKNKTSQYSYIDVQNDAVLHAFDLAICKFAAIGRLNFLHADFPAKYIAHDTDSNGLSVVSELAQEPLISWGAATNLR